MATLPEIRIQYADLLTMAASVPMNELLGDGTPLYDDEYYKSVVDKYKKAWDPYEKKVLHGLTESLGFTFRQNIIDVYIAPWFAAFSFPLVIGVRLTPSEFVNTLTHELVHRLLTDNEQEDFDRHVDWSILFGKHEHITLIHIVVHAVCKAVWVDILNEPNRVKEDIAQVKGYSSYEQAWNYVEQHDYKEIIEKVKKLRAT